MLDFHKHAAHHGKWALKIWKPMFCCGLFLHLLTFSLKSTRNCARHEKRVWGLRNIYCTCQAKSSACTKSKISTVSPSQWTFQNPIQDHQIVQLPRLRKTTFWGCPYLGLGKSLLRQTQGASSRVCALWAWAKAAAAPSMLRPTPCPLLLGATAA